MANSERTAIITGAGSGLGRALAVRLAQAHWQMALVDVNVSGAEETLELVRQAGGQGEVHEMDVSNQAAWTDLVANLRGKWEQLDLLINNAGVCGAGQIGDFPLADWDWLLGINLHGVITGCHVCMPWLKENSRKGHIINTSSMAAYLGAPNMGAYNVAKAGVLALSETMYTEQGPNGIGITVLCPGFFSTNLLEKGRFQQEFARGLAKNFMRRSAFTAEDVADAAIKAMQRRQLYVIHGSKARWLWRIKRFTPKTFLRLVATGWQSRLKKEEMKQLQAEPSKT